MRKLSVILTKVIAALIVFELSRFAYTNRNRLNFCFDIWKRFTPLLFLEAILTICVMGTVGLLLYQLPILNWGWYSLVSSSNGGANITVTPAFSFGKVVGLVFICFLLVLVPYLSEVEEEIFREGNLAPREFIPASIIFGLIHLIMGIPIAFGLALIISGFSFSRRYISTFNSTAKKGGFYFEEASEEALASSTALHSMYNTIIFSVVGLSILFT